MLFKPEFGETFQVDVTCPNNSVGPPLPSGERAGVRGGSKGKLNFQKTPP